MQKHPDMFDTEERELFNKETDEYFQNSDKERVKQRKGFYERLRKKKEKKEKEAMKFEISDFDHELKDYFDRYPDEFSEK